MTNWILTDNLKLFLEAVSGFIHYPCAEWDWDAVRFGIRETDYAQERWYDYKISGRPSLKFWFARLNGTEQVFIKAETEETFVARVAALIAILQCYRPDEGTRDLETLAQSAFADVPYPADDPIVGCTPEHLASCPECQETRDYFYGKRWEELPQGTEGLPRSYAGPVFLSPQARRYFLPAYLVASLRSSDPEFVETALNGLRAEDKQLTPLQQELIEFVLHLPEMDRTGSKR